MAALKARLLVAHCCLWLVSLSEADDMLSFLQLTFVIHFLLLVIFKIIYGRQQRVKTSRELMWISFGDATAFNSGLVLVLHAAGKIFTWTYTTDIDNYLLYAAIMIAGFLLMGGVWDNLRGKKED